MASTTRGGSFGAADRLVWALGGRGKGRAPGADFYFWLLCLHAPPKHRSDRVRERRPRGGGRIKLWFVTNGPKGALEGPGAHSARVLGRRLLFLAVVPRYPPPRLSGGPDEAVVRHQRTSGGVGRAGRHVRERRPHESTEKNCKMRKFSQLQSHYQNAKIFTLSMMRKFFYSWVGPRRPVAVGRSDAGRGSLRPLASHNSKCF